MAAQIFSEFIKNYIEYYLLVAMMCLSLAILLKSQRSIVDMDLKYMGYGTIMIFVLSIADMLEVTVSDVPFDGNFYAGLWFLRTTLSIIGYTFKPAIVLFLFYQIRDKRDRLFYGLLASLVTVFLMCLGAYFAPWYRRANLIFRIDLTNHWNGGSFSKLPFILSTIYMVVLLIFTMNRLNRERNAFELACLSLCVVGNLIAALCENNMTSPHCMLPVAALSYLLYYTYLFVSNARHDALTGLKNRGEFYRDCGRYEGRITAVISVDMNNLKTLNDKHGHAEGDKALSTIAKVLMAGSGVGVKAYRTGGDEFILLCTDMDEFAVRAVLGSALESLDQTPYSCAFGYSMVKKGETIEKTMERSDANMYKQKAAMKAGRNVNPLYQDSKDNANEKYSETLEKLKRSKKRKSRLDAIAAGIKKARKPLTAVLAVILVLVFIVSGIPLFEHVAKKSSEESRSWMSGLSDDLLLSEINIPGTHDSGTEYVQIPIVSKCQDLNFYEQLEAGYRYLDIRLEVSNNDRLDLVHGITHCKYAVYPWTHNLTLENCLEDCYAFLSENPSETIVFMVKMEQGDDVADLEEKLNEIISYNPDMWYLSDTLPSLGECRGKLVLLRRYSDEAGLGENAGIKCDWVDQGNSPDEWKTFEYNDNETISLMMQDRYSYDAESKWTAFLDGLAEADQFISGGGSDGKTPVAISFLSTKGTKSYGWPYFFASNLNKKLLSLDLDQYDNTGWIAVDFASYELAEKIYRTNFD